MIFGGKYRRISRENEKEMILKGINIAANLQGQIGDLRPAY